ncbi:MAG: ABC transporter ATP-binding protein [Gemmataceae bacterium]
MTIAVATQELSKEYRLGETHQLQMFGEVLLDALKRPFSRKKRTRSESFWALRDVSLEIQEGEIIGIIGPNGAGKSTFLKLLSRITYPTKGSVTINGRLSSLLEVGTGFHEEMTGQENIYLNGAILGMSKKEIDSKLDAIVEFAGVEKFLHTPIKRYSSGMRLRLGFAVAAHLDSEILIIDEVLAVGDAEFQKKCLSKMNELQSCGRTVLLVSHNLYTVESLCSRAIWLDQGQVRRDGPPQEVICEYLNRFAHQRETQVDLSQISPRRGNGKCLLTGVEFLDQDGQPKEMIRSGDALTIRLSYQVNDQLVAPLFCIKLTTESGQLVTDLSTWGFGMNLPSLELGEGTIDFEIDFLNLMPGEYFLTLSVLADGRFHYDTLDECLRFPVERSNYFKSGRGIDKQFGLVFFPGRWRSPVPKSPQEVFS